MTPLSVRRRLIALAISLGSLAGAATLEAQAPRPSLQLQQVVADSTAFDVVSTLVIGPRHVLLWDAQYHRADAERVAEAIAATGKRLQAIIISHPDEDHYSGLATILARFPGTPVYMTRAGLVVFDSMAPPRFRADRTRSPELFADSLVRPTELPSTRLTLDGVALEVIPDLQGDVRAPTNSALWIPSTRTLLAGDILFRDVYPWFGSSDSASRAAWRGAIQRLAALKPAVVVAGHKPSLGMPDTPDVLLAMDRYLADFDSLRLGAAGPRPLAEAMLARYPGYKVGMLLRASAATAFRGRTPPAAAATPAPAGASGDSTLPAGVWTGTVTTPATTLAAEFVVGRSEGRTTLLLRPEGPPPAEASEVRFDGASLTFQFDAGGRILRCRLTGSAAQGLEGNCGETPTEPGPFQLRMVPPRAEVGS